MTLLLHFLLILVATFVEMLLGGIARLRSERWALDWLRACQRVCARWRWWRGWAAVAVLVGVPVAGVLVALLALSGVSSFLGLMFSLALLMLMIGPEDLNREVAEHKQGLTGVAPDLARRTVYLTSAAKLSLGPPSGDEEFDQARGELAALGVGAHALWYQPIFWFFVLGPCGAVAYRLVLNLQRDPELDPDVSRALERCRDLLEWPAAHITAIALGTAGTLVPVIESLRQGREEKLRPADLVARAALAATDNGRIREVISGEAHFYRINQMHALVKRGLTVWLVLLALFALAVS